MFQKIYTMYFSKASHGCVIFRQYSVFFNSALLLASHIIQYLNTLPYICCRCPDNQIFWMRYTTQEWDVTFTSSSFSQSDGRTDSHFMLKWHQSNRVFFPTQIMQAEKGKDLQPSWWVRQVLGKRILLTLGADASTTAGDGSFCIFIIPWHWAKRKKCKGLFHLWLSLRERYHEPL